jgi:hypothetical protein
VHSPLSVLIQERKEAGGLTRVPPAARLLSENVRPFVPKLRRRINSTSSTGRRCAERSWTGRVGATLRKVDGVAGHAVTRSRIATVREPH